MIRKAIVADAQAIHDLLKQILLFHKAMYPQRFQKDAKYSLDDVKELINDPKKLVYVYQQTEILGYIIADILERVIFIDDLCVDETHRGQKIGEQLVQQIFDDAGKMGVSEIQLNVWEKNIGAKHFYDKLGFKPLRTILYKPTK